MEIITELDGYQAALSQINMNESVMPYVNGRLVSDKAYNKVQKILNCPEMIASHKYLYNLDLDQLTEDEEGKIDQLYKLGCDRGFIINDLTDYDDTKEQTPAELPAKNIEKVEFKDTCPCWTVIYSATDKTGQIKTGEAYSNAISAAAAKADVNSKLSAIGYANISILAIEQCDAAPVNNQQTSLTGTLAIPEADDETDDSDIEDDDDSSEESTEDDSDDSNDEDDTSSDDSDDSSDDDSNDSDDSSDDTDSDDTSDEDTDDLEDSDDKEDSSNDDEDTDDDDGDDDDGDDADGDDADGDDADGDGDDDDDDDDGEKEELDPNKKAELKDQYRRAFKNTLVKCKFDTSFNDLTLEQKIKFFTALTKVWTKNEPNEFMTDKEIEQLNNVVVKEND